MNTQTTLAHLRDVHGWNDTSIAGLFEDGRTPEQGHADEHTSGAPLDHTHNDLCAHCGLPVYGGKGDWWHTATADMHCADGGPLAAPMDGPDSSSEPVDPADEFRRQILSALAVKVRADFPTATAIVLHDETQVGDDGKVWTIREVALTDDNGTSFYDPTDEDDIASAVNLGHIEDVDTSEFADWHSFARDAVAEFTRRFPEDAHDGEVIDLPPAPAKHLFVVQLSTAVPAVATAAPDETAEDAEALLRSTSGLSGTTADGHTFWLDMDIDDVRDHTDEYVDGLAPNEVSASAVGAIEAYVEATSKDDALAQTRQMHPCIEVLLHHDDQGRTVTVTLDAEGEWDDQVQRLDERPDLNVILGLRRRIGRMVVNTVTNPDGTRWTQVLDRDPNLSAAGVSEDAEGLPLTPTQREVAVEHVKALCGVSKRQAANMVDTRNYDAASLPAEDVAFVVGRAVAGHADARSVALLLNAMGAEDVDLFDGTVYFGQLPDRRFAWSGTDEVYNVGTGQVDGATITTANPRRAAKALAALTR